MENQKEPEAESQKRQNGTLCCPIIHSSEKNTPGPSIPRVSGQKHGLGLSCLGQGAASEGTAERGWRGDSDTSAPPCHLLGQLCAWQHKSPVRLKSGLKHLGGVSSLHDSLLYPGYSHKARPPSGEHRASPPAPKPSRGSQQDLAPSLPGCPARCPGPAPLTRPGSAPLGSAPPARDSGSTESESGGAVPGKHVGLEPGGRSPGWARAARGPGRCHCSPRSRWVWERPPTSPNHGCAQRWGCIRSLGQRRGWWVQLCPAQPVPLLLRSFSLVPNLTVLM